MLTHKQSVLAGLEFCALCYAGRKGRQGYKGHLGEVLRCSKGGVKLALKKPGNNGSSSASLSATGCAGTTLANFPTLWEFLTLTKWPDASLRRTGTIILFIEGDKWKACLKDPNGPRVAFVTGRDVDSLLLSVEAGLDADELDWRADRPQGGQPRKLS